MRINCYTTSTRYAVTEHAELNGTMGNDKWLNRPWYKYKYQNALRALMHKLYSRVAQKEQLKQALELIDSGYNADDVCVELEAFMESSS